MQKYCGDCRIKVSRELNKGYEAEKRRAAGNNEIGSLFACADCSNPTPRLNSQQKYCPHCSSVRQRRVQRIANKKYDAGRPPRIRDKEESRQRNRRYAARHRKELRKRSAEYNERNRDAINRKAREFRQTQRRKEWLRRWVEKKQREDPKFTLNMRMRTRVRIALRGAKAGRSWQKILGYSAGTLARHIERQFLPGMSWQNIGKWHVDHIVPLASFNYQSEHEPDFRAAWALTNLRPLWDVENYSKGGRRLHLI